MRPLNKFIEYGTLVFVFLIPWQARWIIKGGEINNGYWEYGIRSLYATEVLLGLVLLAVIVKGAIWFRNNRSGFDWRRLFSPAGALLFFLIWAGLSIIWSIDRGVALQHFVFLILAVALFVILEGAKRSGATDRIHFAIIFSVALQAAIALIQFFSQSIPASTIFGMSAQSASTLGASVVETVSGRWLRAYGTFPHPNILGAWLALGLIIWFTMTRWRSGIVKWSSFIVILSGLLATFSRSAWLAAGIGLFVYWIIGFRQNQTITVFKTITITIITVSILAIFFPSPFFSRLSSNNRLEIKSTEERTASLSQGWQIIKKDPLTGVGLGNYGLAVHQYLDNTKPAWYYQPAHNVFLLIWSELGLIGVLFMILFILSLLRPPTGGAGIQLLYFFPLLILMSLDHYFWSLYSGMMILAIWLILAKKHTFSSSDY